MYWIKREKYIYGESIYELTNNVTEYISNNYDINSNLCNDMINLSYLHQPAILNLLDKRYSNNFIYTNIGKILIAVNPFKKINYNLKNPCPENIAKDCINNNKNNTILVNGESGSGKTETCKIILNFLNMKNNKISEKILTTNVILESFGNAKTIRNHNSSRFGKFISIFYKDKNIVGSQVSTYLLETIRITHHSMDERNYHIFYYLFKDYHKFNYLNHNAKKDSYLNDEKSFQELLEAFDTIGITEDEIKFIFNQIRIITYLGNYEEYKDKIAELLNIQKLDTIIYKEKIIVMNEIIYKELSNKQSKEKIDSFAKLLYQLLFDFIILKINKFLQCNDYDRTINLLDIFGFEVFKNNSLEQLCINYTNENLQNLFNKYIFGNEIELYKSEKINIDFNNIESFLQNESNDKILETIENKHGVLDSINEVSSFIKGVDKQILDKLHKYQLNNKILEFDKLKKIKGYFTINHYAGKVEYNVDNFINKNNNKISDDVYEFVEEQISSYKENKLDKNKKSQIVKTFKSDLKKLIKKIEQTQLHFIRCIKPNDKNIADFYNYSRILQQIRYNGIVEAVRISRAGFPIRFVNNEYEKKYWYVETTDLILRGKTRVFLTQSNYDVLELRRKTKKKYFIILIQKNIRRHNYQKKYQRILKNVIIIQSIFRMIIKYNKYQIILKNSKSLIIHKYWKKYIHRKRYLLLKKYIIKIQIKFRIYLERRKLIEESSIIIYNFMIKYCKYYVFIKQMRKRIKSKNIIHGLFLIRKAKILLKQKVIERNNIKNTNEKLNKKNKDLENRIKQLEEEDNIRRLEEERRKQMEEERREIIRLEEKNRQLKEERIRQLKEERIRQLQEERIRQLQEERIRQFEEERRKHVEEENIRRLEAERIRQLEAERIRQLEEEAKNKLNKKNKELEEQISRLEKESRTKLSKTDYVDVVAHLKGTIEHLSLENQSLRHTRKQEQPHTCIIT